MPTHSHPNVKLLNDLSIFLHPPLNVKFVFECLCVSEWAIHLTVKSSIYPETMWYWNHAVRSCTSKWVSETAISQCSLDKKRRKSCIIPHSEWLLNNIIINNNVFLDNQSHYSLQVIEFRCATVNRAIISVTS